MNILHLSHSDLQGGAARAAYRLHRTLLSMTTSSTMLVQTKMTDDPTVHAAGARWDQRLVAALAPYIDRLPVAFYGLNPKGTVWHPAWFQSLRLHRHHGLFEADALIFYWICNGFLNTASLARLLSLRKPLIWRLSDMWPFTGGCHYSGSCERFVNACGRCPQLNSTLPLDLSRLVLRRKKKAWTLDHNPYFTVVSPSNWLAEKAARSSLFRNTRINVIRTGVDTQLFKPTPRSDARHILNLPQDKFLILFGSDKTLNDRRKGGHLLKALMDACIRLLKVPHSAIQVVLFGTWQDYRHAGLASQVHALGRFQNDLSLPLIYAACDLFVSLASEDNLPNTVIEALACGTPCVAFGNGGIPEIIDHQEDGFLAPNGDVEAAAAGIGWFFQKRSVERRRHADLARRKVVERFDLKRSAEQYLSLIHELSKAASALTGA
jgi:glycosyltransferase involved in cell wall biosynthesis